MSFSKKQQLMMQAMLAAAMAQAQNSKAMTYPHGPDGLFSGGPQPGMPVAIPAPSNLAGALPLLPSNNENYVFEIATGVSASTGTTPDGICDTPPVAGKLKVCRQVIPFGQYYKATEEFNLSRGNLRRDITDTDRVLENGAHLVDTAANPFVPVPPGVNRLNINNILGKQYLQFGQSAALDFSFTHIQGDATRTGVSRRSGFVSEYNGLDTQIKTGYVDSVSGTACDAADSVVNTTATTLGNDTVDAIIDMVRSTYDRAEKVGMAGFEGAIITHPTMRYELFDVWACNYATVKCNNTAGDFDLYTTSQRRDYMMTNSVLMIDGREIPVLFDYGMATTFNASTGAYTGDLFFVPLRWMGTPLTFLQYHPYSGGEFPELFANLPNNEVRVLNNGLFMMGVIRNAPFCFQHAFTAEMRLILKYPFLAGRVDDITYTPGQTIVNPQPGSTNYVDGGVTART